jgi:hypothetical protein
VSPDAFEGEVEPVIDFAVRAAPLVDGLRAGDLVVREEDVPTDGVRDRLKFIEVSRRRRRESH